ncbi:MAG TPA: AAA family ATPase, partial [Candidatus Saccharimonadales bacterium]|nr:AAA family ATPase [Candidatus Saccharimonadales bacterium]
MKNPKLYLFIGYPGAGKTAVAKIIADHSNAYHLWADVERHKLFPHPTHSTEESNELYDKLNTATEYMLGHGKSVI